MPIKSLLSKLSAALTACSLATATPQAAEAAPPMSLAELVSGAIPLIPGDAATMQAYLQSPMVAPADGRNGWRYPPVSYRTREGFLLRLVLISDWESPAPPPVVRLSAAVDAGRCVNGKKLTEEITRRRGIHWTALSDSGRRSGWTAIDSAKYVTVNQWGDCVSSIAIDVRRQPRMSPPIRPMRIDASGHVVPVALPRH
ncbi:hypothetical protein [Dyella sp. 333MFSha]|uniref:hypothetical protein n=1 Tax=Dyella sp. 333MFSha TaxID=1798240 RepID=UPI0008847E4E|nr:hypothetical protein [Dyella sp. 333MFSha]SDF41519.1 hypothetical protein SAMN04515659_0899 [Dyella sp. 333MFSha]